MIFKDLKVGDYFKIVDNNPGFLYMKVYLFTADDSDWNALADTGGVYAYQCYFGENSEVEKVVNKGEAAEQHSA